MSDAVTIYMRLLDENIDVWRPVDARPLPGNLFLVLGPVPDDEVWAFPPGKTVRGEIRTFDNGEVIVAAPHSV